MLNAKSSELKRCTVCRRWYHPSVKAVAFQKTCSDICRKMRRRRLARSRRERDLQDSRVEEQARQFDRSASWVSRRLALVALLPDSVQQQIRSGKIAPHVAMKYLVPMARASVEHCKQMAAAIAAHKFSSREAGELYAAWRDTPPVRFILSSETFWPGEPSPIGTI